jgi:hypothetical protein
MPIKNLTDEERRFLSEGIASYDDALKCLHIIDSQESELVTLRKELAKSQAQAESWERGHDYAWQEKVEAESRLAAANALLARIGVWADTYGASLKPGGWMADTFGDGVRHCKEKVKAILVNAHLAGREAVEDEQDGRS